MYLQIILSNRAKVFSMTNNDLMVIINIDSRHSRQLKSTGDQVRRDFINEYAICNLKTNKETTIVSR